MGRKLAENLEVKIPTYFRCPISLEVMQSPVSLCTGITYDRNSIQQWLQSGHTTCPATMLPLPSTDLIPNLTLRRLIHHWSSNPSTTHHPIQNPYDILRCLRSGIGDPVLQLRDLLDFFSSKEIQEYEKNNLVSNTGCTAVLASILASKDAELSTLELVISVFASILKSGSIHEKNKKTAVSDLRKDVNISIMAITRILKDSQTNNSRIAAAEVLCSIVKSSDQESKVSISESTDLIEEVVRLIIDTSLGAGIYSLEALASASKRSRVRMVNAGAVEAAIKVLELGKQGELGEMKAMKVMEMAAGLAEGRAEIIERDGVKAVVRKMMKVGTEGAEATVGVLWSVCCRFGDRKAMETAEKTAERGMAMRILVLMQSGGLSPAAKRMAVELLKVFKAGNGDGNLKCGVRGYDTHTKHIRPF